MPRPVAPNLAPEHSAPVRSERGVGIETAIGLVLAVAVLYLGAGILVPLVLAVLLAFALGPVVHVFRRLRVPHVAAVLCAVLLAAAVVGAIFYLLATQLIRLSADLPSYQRTVAEKAETLQSFGGTEFLTRLGEALGQINGQFGGVVATGAAAPTPVTIANQGAGMFEIAQSVLGAVLGPLTTLAIVTVFLIFLLLEREDLRDRFLKLVSRGDLRTSTRAMNEAATRVGRYLLVQFSVNLSYGIVFAAGLWVIGVPNAVLWGMLAAMFRYIPFVGTLIAASIPFTLAFAVDPGWSMLISAVALYVALEAVTVNAIEPRLYGSSTGLSALAVLVAAMFWATLWGPIGLILSTPITVCLVVLGRYVPHLAFLETMLGSEPVLRPAERFYQRLVAGNVEEAIELAEDVVEAEGAREFYETIALPALRLAEKDLSHDEADAADVVNRRRLVESFSAVLAEVEPAPEKAYVPRSGQRVLVIGVRTELDGAAAALLGRMLGAEPEIIVLPPFAVRLESIGQLDLDDVGVVVLCHLGEDPRSILRFVARRLRKRDPDLRILACLFNATAPTDVMRFGIDAVARDLDSALAAVSGWRSRELEPQVQEHEVAALRRLSLMEGPLATELAEIASAMDVPVALLDFVETGDPRELQRPVHAVARAVIAAGTTMAIDDVTRDERFADDPLLLENGVRFCAAAPLRTSDGTVIGALALLDHHPRALSEAERDRLELHAMRLLVALSAGGISLAEDGRVPLAEPT